MADASGLKAAVINRGSIIARRLAIDLEEDLVRAAQPHRKTGEMSNAIDVRQSRTGTATWKVVADVPVPQAAFTDKGTRPHVIRPRRTSVLRFVADGRVVFARVVQHPGTRGSRWFSKTISQQHVRSVLSRFVGR